METNNQKILLLEKSFADFMINMGLDLNNESLSNTPKRVAKMFYNETCSSLYQDPPVITVFPNDKNYKGMIVLKDLKVNSLCEHHFQPIIGTCDIAYIPEEKIVGLSKFARVVDYFSRKPQLQERLTQEIYDFWEKKLQTKNIIVRVKAEHFCMKIRGVKDPCSNTVSCIYGGDFLEPSLREEFFNHLKI